LHHQRPNRLVKNDGFGFIGVLSREGRARFQKLFRLGRQRVSRFFTKSPVIEKVPIS
jgi:hypothetical protein